MAAAATFLILVSCHDPDYATINNDSGIELRNVVISGSGFSQRVGTLAPAARYAFAPKPRGESGVRVEFDVADQHYDSGEQGYFEGSDYRVSIRIDRDMKIAVDTSLR